MQLKPPPISDVTVNPNNRFSQTWILWFQALKKLLDNTIPQQVPSYTVLTLPTAADYTGFLIYVSNESGGATLAFSDGVNWRRVQDRAIVT